MKTPDDFIAEMMPPPPPKDEAAARQLGVTADEYRVMKPEIQAEERRRAAGGSETPPDIAAEEAAAGRMRREPGIIKLRNETPNLFVQAAKTPGEVAQMILFVLCYILELAGIVVMGGERLHKIPGLFQFVLLGILVLPTMWITSRIWAGIGERARHVFRIMVRFWPLTLVALFFALVILGVLKRRLGH